MSTLKTSVSVQSTSLFPASINLSRSTSSAISGDTSHGKAVLTRGANTVIHTSPTGGRGVYLYASSPATNSFSGAINIFGENTLADGEPLATLHPGEFALIPVSYRQGRILATSTNGSQILDYLVCNRGEAAGQSSIFKFYDNGGNWKYVLTDSAASDGGDIKSTGFNQGDYSFYLSTRVTGKGYLFGYDGSGTYNALPIDSLGNIVSHSLPNYIMDEDRYDLDGKGVMFRYNDGNRKIGYFDGDTVTIHSFVDASGLSIDSNFYDYTTSDGTFALYVEDYEGTSNRDATFLVNSEGIQKISDVNYDVTEGDYTNSYVYNFANFVLQITSNDWSAVLVKELKIFSTAGVLLKSVEIPADYEYAVPEFYGVGRCLIRMYSDSDANLPWLFFNYDQSTNTLTGEDLSWTHARGSEYYDFDMLSSRLYLSSDANYSQNGLVFALSSSTDDSNHPAHINVDYLDLVYMFEGETVPTTYTVHNNPGSDFWIGLQSAVNEGNGGVVVSDAVAYLPWALSTSSGAFNVLRLAKGAEPTSIQVIADQTTLDAPNDYGAWRFEGFGDKLIVGYALASGKTGYKVVGSSVLDTITTDTSYEFNLRIRGRSVFIRTWSSPLNDWYFNQSTNKLVKLSTFFSQRWYMEGTTANGENNGIMILLKPNYYQPNGPITAAVLNNGNLGTEKTLLAESPDSWEFSVTPQGIALAYRETSTSNWKIRVFNPTDLNLIYSIDTEMPNYYSYGDLGNRNYWIFDSNSDSYKLYSLNKSCATVTEIPIAYGEDWAQNQY